VKLSQDSRQYSIPFIGTVGVATLVMTALAWFIQNRSLAASAAVLGLYTLHLISVRFITEGQADDRARMESQWSLLKLMVDPNAVVSSAPIRRSASSGDLAVPATAVSGNGNPSQNIPTARHFALGTVALIRDLLTPAEVAQILVEQRNQPDERFAAIAIDLGMLSEQQREELLLAQQEGLFTDEEMRDARERLREFRQTTAQALSSHQ
jgi:hypothetical protein